MEDQQLQNNTTAQRFELVATSETLGFAQYKVSGTTVTITHTEIEAAHQGKGYGSILAKLALDQIRANGQTLVPACGFIASYVQKHPEYADLVAS